MDIFIPNMELRKKVKQLEAQGFIVKEPGLDKDAKRNREYQKDKMKSAIRKVVEDTVKDF